MRVSEVKPGMKGYGLTVFHGTQIDRFNVEVVSILKNFNPSTRRLLIKFWGQNLERIGPIAGMSGSPIYLKDEAGRETDDRRLRVWLAVPERVDRRGPAYRIHAGPAADWQANRR
jgi:hypothetical protein